MRKSSARSRGDYIQFLEERIEASTGAPRATLSAALLDASNHDRTISPLATLARIVEACDAIESGAAAALAKDLKQSEGILRPTRTPINFNTIAAYVQLRFDRDHRDKAASEWKGPRRETLSRTQLYRNYIEARHAALNALRPSAVGSRAKRADELISFLPTMEDQQEMRHQLANGYRAQRELVLLKKAIENNFPEISLGRLLRPGAEAPAARTKATSVSSDKRRPALAQLRNKLSDNDRLRHFGLENDGSRLKTLQTRAPFLEKEELRALLDLLDEVLS